MTNTKKNLCVFFCLVAALLACGADWPQFRGLRAGVALEGKPPTTWNTKEHVVWKTPLPGRGPSSPIVIKRRVIVTASDGGNQERLIVLCFDANTGKQLWRRDFWATGRTATHPESANAAPTPASDGERVFAFYSSNDLVCLNLDGELQWYRGLAFDYPKAGNDVGMASSPVVVDGTVVVQVENQGDSFAAGIDAKTGETRWRIEREPLASWTSPVAAPASPGKPALVLLQSANGITAHNPATGELRWRYDTPCDGIPSPTLMDDQVVFVAADRLVSLKVDEKLLPEPAWDSVRMRPGSASPVLAGQTVYSVNRTGVLAAADAQTGEHKWQLRLEGEFWGTPVVSGDLMFLVNKDGDGLVVRLGDEQGEILSTNSLEERVQSSPALAGDALYIRTEKSLWKIAEE